MKLLMTVLIQLLIAQMGLSFGGGNLFGGNESMFYLKINDHWDVIDIEIKTDSLVQDSLGLLDEQKTILRKSFYSLKKRDLLKNFGKVNVLAQVDKPAEYMRVYIEDEEMNTSGDPQSRDLLIRLFLMELNCAEVDFLSVVEGGMEYRGTLEFLKENGIWYCANVYYISTIE